MKIFKAVIDSLVKYGIDTETVLSFVNFYRTHFNEKYTRLGIKVKPELQFSSGVSKKSINQIEQFIEKHQITLAKAEEIFGVQKEIIAIILWVETKFGEVLGNHHLLSVFFSMAMTSGEPFLERHMVDILKDGANNISYDDIIQRARRKESYALQQLQALVEIQKRKYLDVRELYGSYAGAFGIPQFVPTSYLQFAIDGNGDKKIDLFDLEDAIFSVANYLHQNGWNRFDTSSFPKTLFKYNKDQQYVSTIMSIFHLIKSKY
ncbi:MAG: lytic murein transglycosylase [Candidatus Kapaibacteriota bacterium]